MVRATIWDDGEFLAPVLRVDGEHARGPGHPPLSKTDCAAREHPLDRTDAATGHHTDGGLELARPWHRAQPGFAHRERTERLDHGGARHYALEWTLDPIFGGDQVLSDPSVLGKNGVARSRANFSFHHSRQGGL